MTRKQRRSALIATCLGVLALATTLVLYALKDKITYFRTPSDIAEQKVKPGQRFRLGGLVEKGSVKRGDGTKIEFAVTDTLKAQAVTYQGVLPDLFREGQGVVTEGVLDAKGTFVADTVLAKHDENYMPPDVAKGLKDRGVKLGPSAEHKAGDPATAAPIAPTAPTAPTATGSAY
jgi:cytochrome c-type biogenesis protein CcmE